MNQENELEETFSQEYEAAKLLDSKSMLKPALILYSKSLFAILDYIIYIKYKRLPKNHSDRFRILEKKEADKYQLLDEVWGKYTDAYSKPSDMEAIEQFKNAIKEVIKDDAVSKKIKESVDKKDS